MSIYEYAQTNFENLLLVLEDSNYDFWPVEYQFSYGVETTITIFPSEQNIGVSFTISELDEAFFIKAPLNIQIEKKEVPRISTALAIINNSIRYGKFQLDVESLMISYQFAHYYGSNVVTDGQYDMLITGALTLISDFYEQIGLFGRAELSINELLTYIKENSET